MAPEPAPAQLPPPPERLPVVHCPGCAHTINEHQSDGCQVVVTVVGPCCPCRWSPNHIAAQKLFGELTPQRGRL